MKPTTSTTRTTTTTTIATTTTMMIAEPETKPVSDRTASSSPSLMTSPPSSSTDYSTNHIPGSTLEKGETPFKNDPTPVSEASFLPPSSTSTSGLDDFSGATALNPDDSNEKAVDGTSDNMAPEDGSDAKSTHPGGSSSNSYLQLIVGVTLGVAVGMVVVGILLWLWAKNRRERMERRIMKNHIDIHCSSDDNPYHH